MTPPPRAYLTGLRLLARRELTSAQLRDRLLRRQIDPDEVDAALDRLRAEGALDDRRAARAAASAAVRVKGRGRRRVAQELEALGLDGEAVRAALDEAYRETDERALLERAIDRRLRGPIRDEAHLHRLHQHLVRLGFSPGASLAALKRRRKG